MVVKKKITKGRWQGADRWPREGFPHWLPPTPPSVAPNKYLQGMPGPDGPGQGRYIANLLEAALEVGGADVATSHGALHILLKQPPVVLQDLGGLLVQWVLRVGLL